VEGGFAARARLGAALLYVGERDDRDFATFPATAESLDAYTKLDLSAEVDLFPRRAALPLALTLRVENAGNASYEEIRNYASPGRAMFGGVRTTVRR